MTIVLKPLIVFLSFALLSTQVGCHSLPDRGNYVGLTKAQVVQTLGFPIAIEVRDNKPAAEYWVYYQKTTDERLQPKYLAFSSVGRVESNYAGIDRHALASMQNPEDRKKIIACRNAPENQ